MTSRASVGRAGEHAARVAFSAIKASVRASQRKSSAVVVEVLAWTALRPSIAARKEEHGEHHKQQMLEYGMTIVMPYDGFLSHVTRPSSRRQPGARPQVLVGSLNQALTSRASYVTKIFVT
jgi:hypothetical protein